jgi:hypothetical protein
MLSLNCKHVQHVKIYLPCNFKVNLITHLEVIALFSSNFKNRIALGGHICWWNGTKWSNFIEDLPMIIPGQKMFKCLLFRNYKYD